MNILTFDIEEWYHFDIHSTEDTWKIHSPRIDLYLPSILDLLEEKKIKATFFCLGWIARTYPDIIKRIHAKGHEIGCHSDKHLFIKDMSEADFEKDLKNALCSIEDIIGNKVVSFRAPSFTINEKTKWAFEILSQAGIENDCSVFPTSRSYGGFPSFGEAVPCIIKYNQTQLKEFPINTGKILGKEVVYCGGGYFRLFPYWLIYRMINRSNYVMSYFHMRDFDFAQPKFNYFTIERRFKSYYGLKKSYNKFINLINDFTWIDVQSASNKITWDNVPIIKL